MEDLLIDYIDDLDTYWDYYEDIGVRPHRDYFERHDIRFPMELLPKHYYKYIKNANVVKTLYTNVIKRWNYEEKINIFQMSDDTYILVRKFYFTHLYITRYPNKLKAKIDIIESLDDEDYNINEEKYWLDIFNN